MSAVGVGLIGSGVISDTYLENLGSFPDVEVVIIGDLNVERARAQAEKHGVPRWGTADDVLADPDVQVVVNLTIPAAHVEVSAAAIAAGKHVWTEKPIGLERDGVDALLRSADAAGLRVGSAPDTVLGPGLQTAKRAIESGVIGAPLFAHTSFQTQGPDLWHPGPQFLFSRGAGPLLDMGPYYFTALVSLLGPVDRVAAAGMKAHAEREIRTGPNAGTRFPVEVPTHPPGAHDIRGRSAGAQSAELRLGAGAARCRGNPRHRGLDRHPRPEQVRRPHRLRETPHGDCATVKSSSSRGSRSSRRGQSSAAASDCWRWSAPSRKTDPISPPESLDDTSSTSCSQRKSPPRAASS